MNQLTTFEIASNGNLIFKLTASGLAEINEAQADGKNIHADDFFLTIVECPLCNGLSIVPPEDIGAFTSSLIFSDSSKDDEDKWPNDMKVWWYPNYQVRSPVEDLLEYGHCEFAKGENSY